MKRIIYISLLTITSLSTLLSVFAFYVMPKYSPYHFVLQTQATRSYVAITLTPLITKTPPPGFAAKAIYLEDANTGVVLDNVNGDTVLPMASISKVMTAIIAIENGDLNQNIIVGQDAVNEVTQNDGSSANLALNDKLPLKDLLYGLMLPSGDDSAIAIADGMSGSQDKFVVLMNAYARRLGLTHTHYINADGLTYKENGKLVMNTTSASDMVKLAKYALKNPLFAQIVETQSFTVPQGSNSASYNWQTTNSLLNSLPGVTGIKTGYTDEAGYCLLFSATNGKKKLIGVILNDTSTDSGKRFSNASSLLDWGFQQ